ncbi:NADH-quinone oxidoreductase chain 12 [uncultured Gammaproteobacteria bacterium]
MEVLAVFPPLVGAFIAGIFGRWLGDRLAQAVTCAGMVVATTFSIMLFVQVGILGHDRPVIELMTWIKSGDLRILWELRVDTLSVVMLGVVNVVSTAVHFYSIGYMAHDPSKPRFMAYLSLFTFAMLMLVTANNFVQMYFGWEGVGLCSYLLINFWFERPSANAAAIKAFLVNRVGDAGFALGIALVFVLFNTVDFDTVFRAIPGATGKSVEFLGTQFNCVTLACVLMFIGAMGKSAQLGLHTWLPDAMEGPTPVSALIHAATMVTAGVFMVARLSPMFEYSATARDVVTVVGALTAFVAATIGMTQFDIKRVIAYSTMSQLGYMFFAAGVSAYSASVFHLMTHAFFKALLFLGAGSVIHAMSDEQDMRRMGGLWKLIPVTYVLMWIGNLALAGIPPFAGFYSKDMILEAAYASGTGAGQFAFVLGIAAAFMTAFYSWRLLLMTFHGKPRADEYVMAHVHESPAVMLVPISILALGAVLAGVLGAYYFVGGGRGEFWRASILVLHSHDPIEAAHHLPASLLEYLPTVAGISGILLAFVFYMVKPELPGVVARLFGPVYTFVYRKWLFDELYNAVFIQPALRIGRWLWQVGDVRVIDYMGPEGVARFINGQAARARKIQTGYVYHYAFAMVIGLVVLVTWFYVTA